MALRPTHTVGSYAAAGRTNKRKNDEGLTLIAPVPMAFKGEIADANTPGNVLDEQGVNALVLPANFVPLQMVYVGAVTGTSPTIDIGTTDPDGFGNEIVADGNSVEVAGALFGTALAVDTTVTYTDGVSVPTGGTASLWIIGVMEQTADTTYMK